MSLRAHTTRFVAAVAVLAVMAGCGLDRLVRTDPAVVAVFDPADGNIPMPSDILRVDDGVGREHHLDLPTDDAELSPTELAFRRFMNSQDGWSSTLPAAVEFTGAIDLNSVDDDSVQVWQWGSAPRQLTRLSTETENGNTKLLIQPPREGWEPGAHIVVLVRGGNHGVQDLSGNGIGADAAFYYLRLDEKLDTPENQRAFPGATREQRLAAAADLEEVRLNLKPYFDFFASNIEPQHRRIPRTDIAALWSFTVTERVELAMDRESQRVPLPFDLLIDPNTGLVDLTAADWDTELEVGAKVQANELDGFALSANLMFELTRAVDPTTALPKNIRLYQLGETPTEIPLRGIRVMAEDGLAPCASSPVDPGCVHLIVDIEESALPLPQRTTFALVVLTGLRGHDDGMVVPMPIGHFMVTEHPIAINGKSQVSSLSNDLAHRLEVTRGKIVGLLDQIGRGNVITAWPFTTMNALPEVTEALIIPARHNTPVDPVGIVRNPISDGLIASAEDRAAAFEVLFPEGVFAAMARGIYQFRLDGVGEVIHGAIRSPYLLDRGTRRFRDDGGFEFEEVRFLMTVPEGVQPGDPLPVVIFGHAVVTDRRFLLAIAGELAKRGFAAISIDFPFHGERIACIESSLVSIPNFLPDAITDELAGIEGVILDEGLIRMPPCASGSTASCNDVGECITADGEPDEFNSLPIMDMQPASGAAFLDVHDIPYIKDHFIQALVDLAALKNSLQQGDWNTQLGLNLQTEELYYTGQSLGAIIGAVYTALEPDITRSVLNVPGADMVDLFVESTFFGPQIESYFEDIDIPVGSFKQERLLNVARWLIDSVDPHSIAGLYAGSGREAFLQMDNGDLIIPNATTEILQRVSGLPMKTYPLPLHGDLVVPVIGDGMLEEMAHFLATGEVPQ